MAQSHSPKVIRPAIAALFLALVAQAAHEIGLPMGATMLDVLYHGVEIGAVGLCAWRAFAGRGERAAWLLLATGMALFACGDLYYTLVLDRLASPPFPSPADAGYLGIYPCAYAAIVLLVRARTRRLPPAVWVDGLVVALTFAAIGAALLVPAVAAETGGPVLTVATNVAYPLGDLLLLSIVLGVAMLGSWRVGGTWVLLGAAFITFAGIDVVYLVMVAKGTYQSGGLLDAGWPAAFMLFAAAAWQPPRRLNGLRLESWAGLVIPTVCAAISLTLLVVDHFHRQPVTVLVLTSSAVVAMLARLLLTFGDNLRILRRTRTEALTDALTGLGNRRAMLDDLDDALAARSPFVLGLFDLDGFKAYNDRLGHPAGDALLQRLAERARAAVSGSGRVYRLGGDEFCVIAPLAAEAAHGIVACVAEALSERRDDSAISCSYGGVRLPHEASDASEALRTADRRMYLHKERGRPSTSRETADVLVRALLERSADMGHDLGSVVSRARATAIRLGLDARETAVVELAAELHDVGKLAIPDTILAKPGPLDDVEWEVVRTHTIVGERILRSAPSLVAAAGIVRSSHERFDGGGYPDGLAGEAIPLGARIVAVCDAYDAMTTDRVYRAALTPAAAGAELRRCAGAQFDPRVVEAFCASLGDRLPGDALLAA